MRAFLLLALLSVSAHAATPKPIPAPKATVTFTQGTASRTLNATSTSACLTNAGGVIRARVGSCTAGSYVQFPATGGDVSTHWSSQDACGPKPADVRTHANCPAGTKGNGWDQVATYTKTDAPQCWVLGQALPSDPPAGACTAIPPPTGCALRMLSIAAACVILIIGFIVIENRSFAAINREMSETKKELQDEIEQMRATYNKGP